jgi:hypothetical protein
VSATGTCGHLALEDLRDAVNRIGPEKASQFADGSVADASGLEAPLRFPQRETTSCGVSRLGIEPRTLGLKGRTG